MDQRRRHFLASLAPVLALFALGCQWAGKGAPPVAVPGLLAEEVHLLDAAGTPAFSEFVATAGAEQFSEWWRTLLRCVHVDSTVTPATRRWAQRALAVVDSVLAHAYFCPHFAADAAVLRALPPDSARLIVLGVDQMGEVFADTDLSTADRQAEIESRLEVMRRVDFTSGILAGYSRSAVLAHRSARWDEMATILRRQEALALRRQAIASLSDARCQLAQLKMRSGLSEADLDTLRQTLALDRRSRLASRAAQVHVILAYHAAETGRFATARAHFEDAIEVCREFGYPAKALSGMSTYVRMYANMECWSQVDALARRMTVLVDEIEARRGPSPHTHRLRTRIQDVEARSLMARGHLDEAQARYRALWPAAVALPFEEASYIGQEWVNGMLEQGRADLAEEAFAAVRAHAGTATMMPVRYRFSFWRAWLHELHGEHEAALAALADFDAQTAGDAAFYVTALALPRLALEARIQAGRRDQVAAAAALAEGWRQLHARIDAREPGPEVYLDLERYRALHRDAHAILGGDPEVGYGLELLWRRSFFSRHPTPPPPAAGVDLATEARQLAAAARSVLARSGDLHCLYQIRYDQVVRWTVDGTAVHEDTLTVTVARLREECDAALDRMSRDPAGRDEPISRELARRLHRLAHWLLPPEVLDQATGVALPGARTLLISGDGFLSQLPFSALNVGTESAYRPLVMVVDVVWVRDPLAVPVTTTPGPTLCVTNPTLDARIQRRFHLTDELPGSAREIAAASAVLPDATVLDREAARRETVLAAWEGAGILYFVGHVVHDPEVPLRTWIPLATDAREASYPGLEIKDVLTAHLSRCELVVVSGCGSGAVFVDGPISAPSLGDTFLDAGAAAAVQTFWRIRDEESLLQPDAIMRLWQVEGMPLTRAVSEARRRALAGPNGVRQPFGWAAWTLGLRRFP